MGETRENENKEDPCGGRGKDGCQPKQPWVFLQQRLLTTV